MRTLLGILLLAASLYGGWFLGKQRADRADEIAAAESRSLTAEADGSDVVRAAEAWKRYRETVRLGLLCEGDVGPHPIVVTAMLGVIAWYVLRAGMTQRGRAALQMIGAR